MTEDEVEIGPWVVDESTPLGQAIADVVDVPWYVAFFWMSVGGLIVFVVLFVLLIVWYS